jgi:hypothetical protein
VRLELADLFVACRHIALAHDALCRVVVVLGRVEQPAVGREGAMAEEMAIGPSREPDRLTCPNRNGYGEAARAPRKRNQLAAVRAKLNVVAATRQLDRAHIAI